MKKIILIGAVLATIVSCNVLDTSPKATLSPENYFRTETDLQLFSNTFYNNLLEKNPYNKQSDIHVQIDLSDELHGGSYRQIPASGGGWTWTNLRKMNTLLANLDKCEDPAVAKEYEALTRFFRAFFYFEKVKRFGDVPWIENEIGSADEQLYAPRDSREVVMSHMLEDIDFAIANLPSAVSTYRVNRWSALALKAQFCLFEGTFRKYHGLQLSGHSAEDYLREAADAAGEIISSGPYSLAKDYLMLFAEEDADAGEYILAIKNDFSLKIRNNCTAYAIMPTQGRPGLTKKFVDSFLMKDGTRFTDREGWQTMQFIDEVADRDPRLGCITVTPGYTRIGGTDVLATDYSCSVTGYQVAKWVMDVTLPEVNRVTSSYNDMPVYRLGEVYLIYAEAKAELGTLTQGDLDISVNLLRDRVGMPHLDMDAANADPDPYLLSDEYGYATLAKTGGANLGVIVEIRRERAVELAQEGKRWYDLMRWKEGKCIEQAMYGMYFPGPGEYDLSGDGVPDILLYTTDKAPASSVKDIAAYKIGEAQGGILLSEGDKGYIDPQQGKQHVFDETRDYLYPIPYEERQLNPNLTQNPGWNDNLGF